MASSSSSFTRHMKKHQVYVSFMGEDIPQDFINELFLDLKRCGILAFSYDDIKQLKGNGDEVLPEMYEAIERSRFFLIIFSRNYAMSTWRLRELVKILECKDEKDDSDSYFDSKLGLRVIFMDVNREVVRNQTGSYADPLMIHEASSNTNTEEVERWKEALTKAADLTGWDLPLTQGERYGPSPIPMISKEIFDELIDGPLYVCKHGVGLHRRAKTMNLLRFIQSNKVHMLGICGIGGVGKTTIAKAIFNLLHVHFEAFSFCDNVGYNASGDGLVHLQKRLLSDITNGHKLKFQTTDDGIRLIKQTVRSKRLLIVLDDFDHQNQFEALALDGLSDFFCPGSLIIVTSRERQLLYTHGCTEIFEVDLLYDEEALELFCQCAFRQTSPEEDYREVVDDVVQYASGLPLALNVFAALFYGRDVEWWRHALLKLKVIPDAHIFTALYQGFEGLQNVEKEIFLDVAFCFVGEKKHFVTQILDSCYPGTEFAISVLIDKSLIGISDDRLGMHGQAQSMGLEIVREEHGHEPGKRSRICNLDDFFYMIKKDSGTKLLEALAIDLSISSRFEVSINKKTFSRLTNLRLLKVHYGSAEISGESIKVNHCSGSPEYLSNSLRWLHWHWYPFDFLPSNFYPERLVALDMSYSHIKQLWTGVKEFHQLSFMTLRHCCNLANTPDFTKVPNLKELNLEGCIKLVKVHPSVGHLTRLAVLNLKNCKSLKYFPSHSNLESLQILILSGCSKLDKLPPDLSKIKSLVELHADESSITHLPSSINSLSSLQKLLLGRSERKSSESWTSFLGLVRHPTALMWQSLSGLQSLEELNFSYCEISKLILDDICFLFSLKKINLSGNHFASLPESLGQLSQLRSLELVGCKKLQALPELPSGLELLDAQNCTSLEELPKASIMSEDCDLMFSFINCPNLSTNQTAEFLYNMLQRQGCIAPGKSANIFIPGSKIPEWCNHQSEGDCVKVQLPPQWCYSKLKGFVSCCIFAFQDNGDKSYKSRSLRVGLEVRNSDNAFISGVGIERHRFPDETRCISDQMWLSYCAKTSGWQKAEDYIEASFEIFGSNSWVKKCGIRLVFEDDEDENSSRKAGKRQRIM